MKIWITKPTAFEIMMDGMRGVIMHDIRPQFLGAAILPDQFQNEPARWISAGMMPADEFLKKNPSLRDKVWLQIFLSEAPRAMVHPSVEEVAAWAGVPADPKDPTRGNMWCKALGGTSRPRWDGKNRIPYWEFLLEVDLTAETVRLIREPCTVPMRTPAAAVEAAGYAAKRRKQYQLSKKRKSARSAR